MKAVPPLRAVALGIALSVAMVLGACGTAVPPASPQESAPALPSPTPEGTDAGGASSPAEPSAPPVPDLALERLDLPDRTDAAIVDVVEGGPGYVALANDGPQGTLLLTSTDGREWTEQVMPAWETTALVELVAAADGTLVAVGRDTTDNEVELGVAWLSDDGLEWRPAEGGPDLEGAQLIDVIATPDGLLAIGGYPRRDAGGAWTSPDGEVWTASSTPEAFEGAFTWAVAEGGPGFVAVGWRRNQDPQVGFDPAFWTSADGVAWSLAETPAGAPGAQVRDVVALPGGSMLAVGDLVMGGRSHAWRSSDGESWELAEAPESFENAAAAGLAVRDDVAIAVGGRNEDDAGVWVTVDGTEWTAPEDPALTDAYVVEALPIDGGFLLVGALQHRIPDTGSYTTAPMIWLASAS